jgi:metal-responsive CopG/Arc/MetJ family transcriptional regulator
MVIPQEVCDMPTRKRVAMTVSLPPDIAREYESIAKAKGETKSQLFREMFRLYRQDKLEGEFFTLQRYGFKKAKEMKLTEKDVEKLVFEGR